MILQALALLGLSAIGGRRTPRTVTSIEEAKQLPGWKASDLLYENGNLISELGLSMENGNCVGFLRRYNRAKQSLIEAKTFIDQMEVPSPIDSDGSPWFRQKAQNQYLLDEYRKLIARFVPVEKRCLEIAQGMNGQ